MARKARSRLVLKKYIWVNVNADTATGQMHSGRALATQAERVVAEHLPCQRSRTCWLQVGQVKMFEGAEE